MGASPDGTGSARPAEGTKGEPTGDCVDRTIRLPDSELATDLTARKLRAGLALALSAAIQKATGDTEILCNLLNRIDKSQPEEELPAIPHRRESLLVGAAISGLIDKTWEYHGTFEPTITILVRGPHRIQFEEGGTLFSSRSTPGTHFDRAYNTLNEKDKYAEDVWKAAYEAQCEIYERGRKAIIDDAVQSLPGIVSALQESADWSEIPEDVLDRVVREDPSGVIQFVENVSGTSFAANISH